MPPTSVIIADEWIKFKHVICHLYSTHTLEGPNGVIELMKKRHNFAKSKGQYVAKLRDWKVSKYAKTTAASDWKAASHKVSKAKKRGKTVQLYHQNKLVTPKVLRTRGYLTSMEQKSFEVSSPRTPEEFAMDIQSPRPPVELHLPCHDLYDMFRNLTDQFKEFPDIQDTTVGLFNSSNNQSDRLLSDYRPESYNWPVVVNSETGLQHTKMDHWFQFITYVLSNNHLKDLKEPGQTNEDFFKIRKNLFQVLKQFGAVAFLNSAPTSHLPSIQALNESLFRLAIEAEDLNTVHYLLENGLNPNGHVCYHPLGLGVTPLQFTLLAGNLQISRLLVKYNSKLDIPGSGWKSSSIALAILGWREMLKPRIMNEDEVDSPQRRVGEMTTFVEYLLSHGAMLNADDLEISEDPWSRDDFEEPAYFPSRLDNGCDGELLAIPLVVASSYHLDRLVEIFLERGTHSLSSMISSLNVSFKASLRECANWCVRDIKYEWLPNFPLNVVSKLLKAGADVNCRIGQGYDGGLYCLEILTFSTRWSTVAANVLFAYGANPAAVRPRFLEDCKDETLSSFLSSVILSNLTLATYDTFLYRPEDRRWIFEHIDKVPCKFIQHDCIKYMLRSSPKDALAGCTLAGCMKSFKQPLATLSMLLRQFIGMSEDFHALTLILSSLSRMPFDILLNADGNAFQAFVNHISQKSTGFINMSLQQRKRRLAAYLIKAGLNVNDISRDEDANTTTTALCTAIGTGDVAMMKLMLERDAKYDVVTGLCACGNTIHCSALIAAAEIGNIDLIRSFVAMGANINICGSPVYATDDSLCTCVTPLSAYLQNEYELHKIQTLLDLGANPNQAQPIRGHCVRSTPLSALLYSLPWACESKVAATNMLLNVGADPLDVAVVGGLDKLRPPLLRIILEKITSLSLPTTIEITTAAKVLKAAIELGDATIVKRILDQSSNLLEIPTSDIQAPILKAVSSNNVTSIKLLFESEFQLATRFFNWELHYHDPSLCQMTLCLSKFLGTLLEYASYKGQYDMVDLLTSHPHGIEIKNTVDGSGGATALRIALQGRYFDIATLLIQKGACINAPCSFRMQGTLFERPCLQIVTSIGNLYWVKYLHQMGADINADADPTALQYAIDENQYDIAEFLIQNGANINAPAASSDGKTCLQKVASMGNLKWVKLLIRRSADPNAPPKDDFPRIIGYTALQHAVLNCHPDVVRFLVEHGANVNAEPASQQGATALQLAACKGFCPIAEFLIRHDADVNAGHPEAHGRTALELSASNGRLDMVQLLLHHGAGRGDENLRSRKNACRFAEDHGHFAIRNLIDNHFKI